MKHKIVSRWNSDRVLFECDLPDDTPSGMVVRLALEKSTVTGAVLTGAVLTGAVLTGADLTDADLTDADLTDAVLTGAVLTGAVLTGAVLTGAVLTGAVLTGADLTGAVLTDAVLTDADLTGADLTGADLTGADLTDADLTGADKKPLPRATPEQAIENLDKVREIILDNQERLNMGHWHGGDDWRKKTCAEEVLCGTTHCLAGWLQVCTTEPVLKNVTTQLAGVLAAPIASKMFFRSGPDALEWLKDRKYVTEYAEAEARAVARKERSANA